MHGLGLFVSGFLLLAVAVKGFSAQKAILAPRWSYRLSARPINEEVQDDEVSSDTTRRQMLFGISSALLLPTSSASASSVATTTAVDVVDYDCLLDLPDLPESHTRVFFCRHGQTENNRLGKVQGSRIDAPINDTGFSQAHRLGNALSRVVAARSSKDDDELLVLHSPLLRARQTAQLAAGQLPATKAKLETIDCLKEVDFGDGFDGKSVDAFRSSITKTYAGWGLGQLDLKMGENGESGRQILDRVDLLLKNISNRNERYIVAISHSSFLRMICAYADKTSLLNAVAWKFGNASVSVVDINLNESSTRLQRTNERRHLGNIAT